MSISSDIIKNMEIYEAVRAVPKEAQKTIGGGRLKGMTDINPMWRIKILTQLYGPCGIGWKVEGVTYWTQACEATGETAVFCQLAIRYKTSQETWSEPIYGIGGSLLIVKESNGIRLDDEAYKKSYTDAMSVACKALGIGADVYWNSDRTKYTGPSDPNKTNENPAPAKQEAPSTCEMCKQPISGIVVNNKGVTTQYSPETLIEKSKSLYGKCLCYNCMKHQKELNKKVG